MRFRLARRVTLALLCIAVLPRTSAQTRRIPPRVVTEVVQQQAPNGAQQATVLTTVPQLTWMNRNQAAAILERLRLGARFVGAEDQIVASLDPPPGTVVKSGTEVTVTMAQPALSLKVLNPATSQVNQDLTFTAILDPPLPPPVLTAGVASLQARYLYQWDDNSAAEWLDQPEQSHRFAVARTYSISVTAMVGGQRQVISNAIPITISDPAPVIPTYIADLQVRPLSGLVGTPIEATVTISPTPGEPSHYVFRWGDGVEDSSESSVASHKYQTAGEPSITAIVTIANQQIPSKPVSVQITAAPPVAADGTATPVSASDTADQSDRKQTPTQTALPIALWIAIGVFLLGVIMIIRARAMTSKSTAQPKPVASPTSFKSSMSAVDYDIQSPEQIKTNITVGFRGGNPSPESLIGGG